MNRFTFFSKIIVFILLGFLLTACSQSSDENINGHSVDLNALQGKWVFINYWATWCKPCVTELPDLDKFYLANKDKNVVVIGVNFDQIPAKQVRAFANKLAITFPLLKSFPLKKYGLEHPTILPTTFVIGPDGKAREALYGPQTYASLEAILKEEESKQLAEKEAPQNG